MRHFHSRTETLAFLLCGVCSKQSACALAIYLVTYQVQYVYSVHMSADRILKLTINA